MSSAPTPDETDSEALLDEFIEQNGDEPSTWDRSYNKKQCPECRGLHDVDATTCGVCGWEPS